MSSQRFASNLLSAEVVSQVSGNTGFPFQGQPNQIGHAAVWLVLCFVIMCSVVSSVERWQAPRPRVVRWHRCKTTRALCCHTCFATRNFPTLQGRCPPVLPSSSLNFASAHGWWRPGCDFYHFILNFFFIFFSHHLDPAFFAC